MTRVEYLGADRLIYGNLIGDFSEQKVIARLPATVTVKIEPATSYDFTVPESELKIFRHCDRAAHRAATGLSAPMKSPVPITPAAQSSFAEQKRGVAILDSERWLGPLLIGPAVLYIFLLVGVPFFMALYYSVSNTTTGGGTMGFVGLRNFTAVIGTPKFQTALKNTIVFGLISQAVILVLSNALALALQHEFPGRRLIRFLILLPWVAPISIGTIAWLWIFDSTYSVLNWMLRLTGLIHGQGFMWLGLPHLAMGSSYRRPRLAPAASCHGHFARRLRLDSAGYS